MKRKSKLTIVLLSLLLGTGFSTYAQEADTTKAVGAVEGTQSLSPQSLSFTLDEAKKYAIEHNRTIQNSTYDVQKSEANRWKALATMLPQINGEVDYSNMFNYKMNMGGIMPSYFDFSINVSMTVSGSQILGVRVAKLSKQLSEIAVGKTEQSITSNIETYYVNILALEKTISLLELNLNNLTELHKMTLNAVKAGAAEQNDADQIAIQVSSMSSAINNSKRTVEVLYNSIRIMTGARAEDEIVLTQTLEDVVNAEQILSLMGSNLDIENNYDYMLQNKTTELYAKQVRLQKMAYVPTLTAFYNFDKKKYTKDGAMNMTPPNTFGVKLQVPIWSTGTRWADVRAAKMDYAKEVNNLEDTKQQLGVQEKQLRYNLVSTYDDYKIQEENIGVMQRVFNSNSEKFKYGTISSMQLTNSGTDLVNAQNTFVNSLLQMVDAYVQYKVLLNK